MARQQARTNPSLTFFGMVAAVMAALKLKQHIDEYREVPADEEEGRVALVSPTSATFREENEEAVSLLNTELPISSRQGKTKKRRSGCCICCGMNCGLFWKAFGIVVGLLTLWYGVKLIWWAVTPTPSPLENMPAYSTSLGCLNAPHVYHQGSSTIKVPIGARADHAFDALGGTVGTIFVTTGASDSEVEYEFKLTSNEEHLFDDVSIHQPSPNEDGSVDNSRLLISTPFLEKDSTSCMRFEITVKVPANLKKFHIASHVAAHVQFDPAATFAFDEFYGTLYSLDNHSMLLPHEQLVAKKLALEVYRGWIVGDVTVVDTASVSSQRGDGVINVSVHPAESLDAQVVDFQTITGSGRTDVFFMSPPHPQPHRPIRSSHVSSKNGDVYLTYRDAQFSGKIALASNSYRATGLQSMPTPIEENGVRWTHWVGDENGLDTIHVNSRGWTGLFF